MKRASLLLLPLLLLGGCATTGGGGDVPANADVTSKTMGNGDKVDEYRVNGQLEMVRVTPARGAPYFLYDRDHDGHTDAERDKVNKTYWQLYSW
ncbi:DUF2782 domain-containing protein [Xanthomonas campestris]|jgi:hypothetical protein|uniref:DUF2782 domain-containing protein n=3 Tax=Xanthomonas campestris pv. campestris TaxID=340 RepID=Q8P3P8_XANCP|nr:MULTISPECIES: DUF2782 domain-containing protein [Xanthomonas]AAM43242.1 conserved hypothetical protein [Xanthomonas campestris pv. campestris str. ATCC 33913]AAY51149.1 conserved hypothetical protein [Xanthomonas campestris pv. campestris str. 8004]AEL05169.1 lipoprotein, putative [Xanthomonas campestris pv. raphani 756C]AKS17938.1 hypothetical protein AEA00_19790 [Xanthomonas campestris pv. campestris]AKS21951.1 hypothetical protein AEA01_19820 [Xanthomonas campestris pv. campestris]